MMGVPGSEVEVENDHTSFAVRVFSLGVLSFDKGVPGVHERMRFEVYLLTGTPAGIRTADEELETSGLLEQADCEVAPTCDQPPPTVTTLEPLGSIALALFILGPSCCRAQPARSRREKPRPSQASFAAGCIRYGIVHNALSEHLELRRDHKPVRVTHWLSSLTERKKSVKTMTISAHFALFR
jgi:hypothetical protein